MAPLALRVVRSIRTFSFKQSCNEKPYVWYFSLFCILAVWANYAQYKRLKPVYPDFEVIRENEGGRMLEAKWQELANVQRYNRMVNTMRSDMRARD
ncbi:hypothetical protein ERJ75_000719700 [Trypanosoma vivax]|uniref:Uncharacterized protein n=1 Tax=Trypanosoma vivax (strain Y486) TaxID=1055687 RepID=G0TWT2_TRYVY|nr:hypothetical protein ERJ75_000719700 [Trypanosoma vivax]CCC48420.1 conserved hypothetical protein [Trypanosoma vivax Y486]